MHWVTLMTKVAELKTFTLDGYNTVIAILQEPIIQMVEAVEAKTDKIKMRISLIFFFSYSVIN